MNEEAIKFLEAEKAKRIAAVVGRYPAVIDELTEIFSFADTICALKYPASRLQPKAFRSQNEPANDTPAPNGFVLIDEVRKVIRKIKSERFRASTVYDIMHDKWRVYITPDKRRTIAATLSNLVNGEELSVEKDGQRKVWYRIKNLRQPMEDDFADLFSDIGVAERGKN